MNPLRKVVMPVVLAAVALLAPLAATSRAAAATVWAETETGTSTVRSTWTWDAANKRFVAKYGNGAVGLVYLQKYEGSRIVLVRQDRQGKLAGLTARYEGTKQGNSFRGTVEWTWNGKVARGTWEAHQVTTANTTRPGIQLNKTRFPEERARLATQVNRQAFPNLGENYEVLGSWTPYKDLKVVLRRQGPIVVLGPSNGVRVYNCIAHTLGIHYGWVNPVTGPSNNPLAQMDAMYAVLGYRRMTTLDYRLVPGKQKVVVYATLTPDRRIKAVTHGALQEADGTWTSKLGALALIRHLHPNALNGPTYGVPVAVYIRDRR